MQTIRKIKALTKKCNVGYLDVWRHMLPCAPWIVSACQKQSRWGRREMAGYSMPGLPRQRAEPLPQQHTAWAQSEWSPSMPRLWILPPSVCESHATILQILCICAFIALFHHDVSLWQILGVTFVQRDRYTAKTPLDKPSFECLVQDHNGDPLYCIKYSSINRNHFLEINLFFCIL